MSAAGDQSAGVGVVRPLPSRKGGSFDTSRPLHRYLTAVPAARAAMSALSFPVFSFQPLDVAPKLALGKLDAELTPSGNGLVLSSEDGTKRLIPLAGMNEYYHDLMDLLAGKHPLALVMGRVADALKKHYSVARQHEEYLMRTTDLHSFAGGRNKQLRQRVNQARAKCHTALLDSKHCDEYLDIVRRWYRQNAEIKFRTYGKTTLDWVFENWDEFVAAFPDTVGLEVRHEGKLLSVNLGGLVSDDVWSAYTQRFDRDQPYKANMLGYSELARRFEACEIENDGTADTKTIKEWKDRLVGSKLALYTVKK